VAYFRYITLPNYWWAVTVTAQDAFHNLFGDR